MRKNTVEHLPGLIVHGEEDPPIDDAEEHLLDLPVDSDDDLDVASVSHLYVDCEDDAHPAPGAR